MQNKPAANQPLPALHSPTPLLYSTSLSKLAGCNVWLKLENMQPTQSFKLRSVGSMCIEAVTEQNAKRFVTVGDTNAALAVSYSARQLGVPATVFVPNGMAASAVRSKIELERAEIVEGGRTVKDAYMAACAYVRENEGAVMIDSADDAAAVAGNATIVPEIGIQLQRREPTVIIAPVGSGGLLAGIITGMHQCLWNHVPVIAVETHNTCSFQKALLSEPDHVVDRVRVCGGKRSKSGKTRHAMYSESLVTPSPPPPSLLPPMDDEFDSLADSNTRPSSGSHNSKTPLLRSENDVSLAHQNRSRISGDNSSRTTEPTVATCLLTGSICPRALELSRAHPVVPISVSEAMAVEACRKFLDDHQMLVEIGCASALSIVSKGLIHHIIPDLSHNSNVVVVISGGANISFDRLESCRQRFPYPAPIIAKSGDEVFMRMSDSNLPTTLNNRLTDFDNGTNNVSNSNSRLLGSSISAVSTPNTNRDL